jgi:His-Xaa-Ser system protein HxsD
MNTTDAQKQMSWIERVDNGCLAICVDTNLYSLESLFRVCYRFTDRCYLYLESSGPKGYVRVRLSRKSDGSDLAEIAGEFGNELINQKVRADVAAETRPIRELIVAQAFAESGVIDMSLSEADYVEDPKNITQ